MIVNIFGRLINTFMNKLHVGKYNATAFKHEQITDRRQIAQSKNAQWRHTHVHKIIKDAFITDQQCYRTGTPPQARK